MFLDAQCTFSDKQNLAQAAGTYVATSSMDLGLGGTDALGNTMRKDIGSGRRMKLLCQVTETFTSGGAATLEARIITGTGVAAGGDVNAGKVVHQSSGAIALAKLKAGYRFALAIPPGIPPTAADRYLSMDFIIAVAAMTAGKITASLVEDLQEAPIP